ncbi:MAG: LysR substrate-binding domain-containing protein [Trebonia sp.]
MEIRELRAFMAVAEEGSLSAAARRLHLSQSALSQTIQSLERQLGVQLLTRSSTGVAITEAGGNLLQHGRGLLAEYDRVIAAVAGSDSARPGILRVGVPLELPRDLLPGVLSELGAAYPLTRVELSHASTAAQLTALEEGQLDAALVRECPAGERFDAMLVVEEPLGVVLAAATAQKLADQAGVQLQRLAGLNWLGFPRAEAPAWHDQVTATLRAHGISPDEPPAQAEGSLIAEVKIAAAGTGRAFALAPPGWAHPLPEEVTWQPLIGNPLVRRTWAVWPALARRRDLAALIAALDPTRR